MNLLTREAANLSRLKRSLLPIVRIELSVFTPDDEVAVRVRLNDVAAVPSPRASEAKP